MPLELRENPVKLYRERLHLSQRQLSQETGVHRMVILRAEQGVFNEIPPRIADYLAGALDVSPSHFTLEYASWVRDRRILSYHQSRLSEALPPLVPPGTPLSNKTYRGYPYGANDLTREHPFVAWRDFSGIESRIAFCKYFCVHPATVGRFEGNTAMTSVPEQLREAIVEAGYPETLINELSVRYNLYRYYQVAVKLGSEARKYQAVQSIYVHLAMQNTESVDTSTPPVGA